MMGDDKESMGGAHDPKGDALDEMMRLNREASLEQARAHRSDAGERGLVIETYIVPDHAAEILDSVLDGTFDSPEEALFILVGRALDLHRHPDLLEELLRRSLERRIGEADAGQGGRVALDGLMDELRERSRSRAEPPRWVRARPGQDQESIASETKPTPSAAGRSGPAD